MITLISLTCFGAPPEEHTTESGSIEGTIVIPADAQVIRALLLDPDALMATTRVGTVVDSVPDGECTLDVLWMAQGAGAALYTARSCPTEYGMHSSLIESRDLARFEADWIVTPVGGGSQVTYNLDMVAAFDEAGIATQASARQAVIDSLDYLDRRYQAPPRSAADLLKVDVSSLFLVN